ncbi:MAG: class I SAM-dependent methyltransferase [Chloroflexota bacterium]|nr:class I SAM-dependent methyltransferase [Chloroflexota bacterium]
MVQRAYQGELAARYDARRFRGAGGRYVNMRELDTVLASLPSGTRTVLDVPTGTGRVALTLAGQGFDVTSIDLSQDMLALVGSSESGPNAPILVQADASVLPLLPYSFDACVCLRFIHFFGPDRQDQVARLLRELARVVKPGGTLIVDTNRRSPRHLGFAGRQLSTVHYHRDSDFAELLVQAGLEITQRHEMFFLAPMLYNRLPELMVRLLEQGELALPSNWRVRVFWICRKTTNTR